MQSKKIGFICNSFENIAGGLERQIIRTSRSFLSKGFEVYIFSFDNLYATSFYKIPEGIKWIKCGGTIKGNKFIKKFKRLKQILFLRKKLKKYQITDLITFHHGIFPRVILASIFLRINNIVSERNSLSHYKYIKLRKYNLGFFSLFFANKITVQLNSYINDYPYFLRKKIKVISNILKKPLVKYKAPNLNSNRIVMAGRLSIQKNFTPLLDQMNESKTQDIQLLIAGEGELRNFFEKNYSELIKQNKVILRGNIKNIDPFLSDAAIFCFPSLWEGYPNSLAEALRLGLPIVTSQRMKYLDDFVEHNINGLILEDQELLHEINKLIKNKNKLSYMSQQSYLKYLALNKKEPIKDWINLVINNY